MGGVWIALEKELEKWRTTGWREQWRREGIEDGKEGKRKKRSDGRKGD